MVQEIPSVMPGVHNIFACEPPEEEPGHGHGARKPLDEDSYMIDARRTMAFDRWEAPPPRRMQSARSIKVALPSFRRKEALQRTQTVPSLRGSTTEGTASTAPTTTSSTSGGKRRGRRRESSASAGSMLRSAKHVVGRAVSVPAFVLLDIVGSLAGRR